MSANIDASCRCCVDVLVAGAGPAGATAAYELAQAGLSVVLADRLPPVAPRLGETLPGAAIRLLQRLGLAWVTQTQGGAGHCRVGGMLVAWNSERMVASDAIADPYGAGLRLNRAGFDAALRLASVMAGAISHPAHIEAVTLRGSHWDVRLEDGLEISASWLVDATGRSGRLARLIGMARKRERPLVAAYRTGRPQRNSGLDRSIIEACPEGWLYAGRLDDRQWVFGLHTSPEEAARLRQSPERWDMVVNRAPGLADLLGQSTFDMGLHVRDARGSRLASPAGERWVACGDAALSFDPIAGQGLFNALRSGAAAAECVMREGRGGGQSDYVAELASAGSVYDERRKALYRDQHRWHDDIFWRLQHGAG